MNNALPRRSRHESTWRSLVFIFDEIRALRRRFRALRGSAFLNAKARSGPT
jgi:hypothetical protein